VLAAGAAVLWTVGTGCSQALHPVAPRANQRPVVELTRAPGDPDGRFEYLTRLHWIGHDPDGRIDHYLYAVDPPGPTADRPLPETTWVRTTRSEELVRFAATRPDTIRAFEDGASDFHTFAIKAIDNGGPGGPLQSALSVRSFYSYTIAPTVQILSPAPSDRGRAYVGPSVRIQWTGTDEDGVFNGQKPNAYRTILLTQNTAVPFAVALAHPDTVRRYYAPRSWAGWDSTGADTTFRHYTDLVVGQDYLFCVVAMDEAGAHSPVFSLTSNLLNFRVTSAAQSGPRLTLWNDVFFYAYNPATYSTLPQYQIRVELPADEDIDFQWIGETGPGNFVSAYRWALDIEDLTDPTPRSNERTDLAHWSAWSALATTARVGPFAGGENHFFYVEARDNNGFKSLGVVNLSVVRASFEAPLLVVNDTRFPVDQRSAGAACMDRPRGRWPMAAELDSFLFARGGMPWRCYPAGTLSEPGLFAGYPFDTLGTRSGQTEVRVPLAVLGRYRHVVWLTDPNGGLNTGHGTNVANSIGALRYMNTPGRANSLAAYVRQGGQVWLAGAGAATAALMPFNRGSNDVIGPAAGVTFSSLLDELGPGRFMHDAFRWRSEVKISASRMRVTRHFGRHDSSGAIPPAYLRLPTEMRPKSAALGDAFPPWRTYNAGDFFVANFQLEYLSRENRVVEDVDPSPLSVDERSTLDTLYAATGDALVAPEYNPVNACMTRYVGPGYPPVLFTGFTLWTAARVDLQALVDAVLQDLWGFPAPAAPSPLTRERAARPAARRATPGRSG